MPLGLTLLLAASVPAASLLGVVVDPQERVVVGAVVSLGCGAATDVRRTDGEGGFRFDRPEGFAGCTIAAQAAGFATALAGPVGDSPAVRIRLSLPVLNETLTVRPREDEAGLSPYRSLASVSIGHRELRAVSDDTGELVRYARARAGVPSTTPGRVHVDGLPAGVLPPADTIDRIVVDADPFSAEHADGSEGRVDIATRTPDRKLRVRLGGSGFGAGGGSALDPEPRRGRGRGTWG